MYKIYKYTLEIMDYQEFLLPLRSKILSVCEQHGKVVFYTMVDTAMEHKTKYSFRIFGTGHPCADSIVFYSFLGTVKLEEGNLMFHVFYQYN